MIKRKTKVNQKKYDLAKTLINSSVKKSEIARILGFHTATIQRIGLSESLDDYLEKIKESYHKYHKEEEPQNQSLDKKVETPIYDTLREILSELKTLNEYISKSGGKGKFRLF